jgi:ElaA protein
VADTSNDLQFTVQEFPALSVEQLYEILRARAQVFVVEQNCAYADADGLDPQCRHLSMRNLSGELLGYTRIVPPGLSFAEIAIGRVITTQAGRGKGLGRALMLASIAECQRLGHQTIRIGAQSHLQAFYQSVGFVCDSEPYLEDGIPHVEMLWRNKR